MTEPGADPSRRQFFRRFAGEGLTSAAHVAGAVADRRDRSAAEASELLGEPPRPGAALTAAPTAAPGSRVASGPALSVVPGDEAPPAGFRTPFRFDTDDVLLVIDQRRLPDELVEMRVGGASDAAVAIRSMVVRGAPAIGQVAAIGLALTAGIARRSQPHTRRAIMHGAANTLRNARPTAVNLRWAVERVMARYEALGELSPDGEAIAGATYAEAMSIVAEATD